MGSERPFLSQMTRFVPCITRTYKKVPGLSEGAASAGAIGLFRRAGDSRGELVLLPFAQLNMGYIAQRGAAHQKEISDVRVGSQTRDELVSAALGAPVGAARS
jgi:hypothetical protein